MEQVGKSPVVTLESCGASIAELQAELEEKQRSIASIGPLDGTDPFRTRILPELEDAREAVDKLIKAKSAASDRYARLQSNFHTSMKSGEFCLLWDNLLVPGDLMVKRNAESKTKHVVSELCQTAAVQLESLVSLWGFSQPAAEPDQVETVTSPQSGAHPAANQDTSDEDEDEPESAHLPCIRGHLLKQSPSMLRLWSYQRRFVTVEDRRLSWWAVSDGPPSTPRGFVDFALDRCEVEACDENDAKFVVRPLSGQWTQANFTGAGYGVALGFDAAESQHSRDQWLAALQDSLGLGEGHSAPYVADPVGQSSEAPFVSMKPLPWRKLVKSQDFQPGESIWDEVSHGTSLLPLSELQSRFNVNVVTIERTAVEVEAKAEEDARRLPIIQQLPPVEDVVRMLTELEEASTDELRRIQEHVCPNDDELQLLRSQAEHTGLRDQYMWAVGQIPMYDKRLSCWIFARTYKILVAQYTESLESFLDVVECFEHSEALPALLGLFLAAGNHLNGGTSRGQADGFDLDTLDKMQGVKDADGWDLRHFVFGIFFRTMREKSVALLDELWPSFVNVGRRLTKDAIGTERLEKEVKVSLEHLDACVTQLAAEFVEKHESVGDVLAECPGEDPFNRMLGEFESAKLSVDTLVLLRDSAKSRYDSLLRLFHDKDRTSSDFCLIWDNFFLPGDLMVNKGKSPYFTSAFCEGEPVQLDHLTVLWHLQESVPDVAGPSEYFEGAMNAEDFCKALALCIHSAEDFASMARDHSACEGTKDIGGDLGEVEKGQMHSAIEDILFHPELEIGKVYGPLETNAGFHLVMATKKNRGMLSNTVGACHILIAAGWYDPPPDDQAVVMEPILGEQAAMSSTWRRWSFAASLPPTLMDRGQNELGEIRTKLWKSGGLRLLFSWRDCFVFSLKGLVSDVARDMVGPLILCGDVRKRVGVLLTSDDAKVVQADKDGFEARLKWFDDSWMESDGLLDQDNACRIEIPMRRCRQRICSRKIVSTITLKVKPTSLAYAACEPGLRLAKCSATSRNAACVTVVRGSEGSLVVRVDNSREETIDPAPQNVVQATTIRRDAGTKLLMIHSGNLVDVVVVHWLGQEHGNRHLVRLGADELEIDLNEMNHSLQRFDSAADFETARSTYCQTIVANGSFIEDAITGKRLNSEEQLVRVKMERRDDLSAEEIARLPFDDVEWVSGQTIGVRDRVWAQGREGRVEYLQKHNHYIVKFTDGSSSPPLPDGSIKKARPIAGVQSNVYERIDDISGLVPVLLKPNYKRVQGAHGSRPVLLRAGPGTGKTWSMHQLLFLLARELTDPAPASWPLEFPSPDQKRSYGSTRRTYSSSSSRVSFTSCASPVSGGAKDPVHLVPLLIPIQKLARMLRQLDSDAHVSNLVLFYIQNEFDDGPTRSMLQQAFEMRALIVLLDGVDEAANVKQYIEDFVTKTLVPMGIPLLITSRPEGIRKRLYARDFVIMNLQPLTTEQQHSIVRRQLEDNEMFERLVSCSAVRTRHDEIYLKALPESDRQKLEWLKLPVMNSAFRQSLADGPRQEEAKFLSEMVRELDAEFSPTILKQIDEMLQNYVEGADAVEEQARGLVAGRGAVVAVELVRILKQATASLGHVPNTAYGLWPVIAARTDDLLSAAEESEKVFRQISENLLEVVGIDKTALEMLPLQDPVSIYKQAQSRHAQGADDVVLDVLRVRWICDDGQQILRLMETLSAGFSCEVAGSQVSLRLLASANNFAAPDAMHFRRIVNSVQLEHGSVRHILEVEVLHRATLRCHQNSEVQHFEFLSSLLQKELSTPDDTIDTKLDDRLRTFEQIVQVPVLLSVLVCGLSERLDHLPSDIYDLYQMGIHAVLRRHFGSDDIKAQVATEMLEAIATANHMAKRRTFQMEDIRKALRGRPEWLASWSALLQQGRVPLIKILTLGETTGEFQFAHLSFQEALFARCLRAGSCHAFWESDEVVCERLNEPFYRNAFCIGKGQLGQGLALHRPTWCFDCQPRLTELGQVGLRNLLAGAEALRVLDLGNVKLVSGELKLLLESLGGGLASIESLSFRWCQLPVSSAADLGRLLVLCPRLVHLDLECNRELLKTVDAASSLLDALTRPLPLTRVSFRWCHIPSEVEPLLLDFFSRCPQLTEVDLLGNRGLRVSSSSSVVVKGITGPKRSHT